MLNHVYSVIYKQLERTWNALIFRRKQLLLKKLKKLILNQSSCKDDDITLNSKAVDNS